MMRRMALSCSRALSTCSVRSVSISARNRRRTSTSSVAYESPSDRLARRDGDFGAGGDRQHAMTHGAVTLRSVLASPRDHRYRQTGQEIRMTPQYPKTAARVFRAQRLHAVFVDDDGKRRDDAKLHAAASLRGCGFLAARLVEVAHHIERALRPLVGFAVEDRAATRERLNARRRCVPAFR